MRLAALRTGSAALFCSLLLACSSGGSGGSNAGSAGKPGAAGAQGAAGAGGIAGGGAAGAAGGAGTTGTAGGGGGNAGASGSGGSGGSGTGGAAGQGGQGGHAGQGGVSGQGGQGGQGGSTAGAGGGAGAPACATASEDKFSFFIVSNKALIREGGADASGMFSKLGGNLGGIKGADAICQHVAEFVSPCQRNKVWHAFLSTTTEDAVDRIGTGPWYDRNGRLWAGSLTTVVEDRPSDADAAIKNDVPNEDGLNNRNPEGTGQVDNHETLTGTGANGRVYTQATAGGGGGGSSQCGLDVGAAGAASWSAERATCWNWTRNTAEGCPRVGHTWCSTATCKPAGSGSGTNWMSVWNEGGCAPGGTLSQTGGLDGSRRVGSAGGYGGFYCFAVIPHP